MKLKNETKRNFIQLLFTCLFNGYAVGFAKGAIFKGATKGICVPVLNCYSCPGALGACPIGSMQTLLAKRGGRLSVYVLGMVMLFGVILGRVVCGFMCPFGLLQDLLYKIPCFKYTKHGKVDKVLRSLKYVVLLLLVIILPAFVRNKYGMSETFFCKYLCPAGTIGAGLPLLLKVEALRTTVGTLFYYKLSIAIVIVLLSVVIYRPFCKYLCPLGAIYGGFNNVAFVRLKVNEDKCVSCKACESACDMGVDILTNINSTECIRCGKCIDTCKHGAITRTFK